MRQRAWALLLLVPAAVFAVVVFTAPFPAFHQHLYLSGTPGRFAGTVVRAGRADARAALWLDNVFVVSWVAVAPRLLRAGLERWAPERRRSHGVWRAAPTVAVLAGVFDLAENGLALALAGKLRPATGLTLTLATLSWSKSLLYAVALAGLVALVVGPLTAPVVRRTMRRLFGVFDGFAGGHPPPEVVDAPDAPAGERIGICLSGGGIRAASVAIGALRRLDARPAAGPSLFRRARWLVAVSGGAYAAGGWRISRRPGNELAPLADADHDGLFDGDHPWVATVRSRRRFLDNGGLSIVGGLLNVVMRSALVLGALLAAAYLVGAALGSGVRTRAVHPWFPFDDPSSNATLTIGSLVPARLVLPGAAMLVVAAVLAVVAFSRSDHVRRRVPLMVAAVLAAAGAGLLVALVGVPAGVIYGRRALDAIPLADRADEGAGLLVVLSTLGVFTALAGVIVAQLKRRWLRLGGVLLAAAVLLFTGKVADTFARGYTGAWRSWPLPGGDARLPVAVVAVLVLVVIESVAAHRLTLGGMYRKRLAATFALGDGDRAPLPPLPYSAEPLWAEYRVADGPELIVAATAHTSFDTFCGLKAYGFTFRPASVTLHDRTDGSSAVVPTATYPQGSWWDGFPRGWLVSRSMALTGAAFASAMGRQALGTTNSLLVALNLRLGAWVPNPRYVHWFADPDLAPRVHVGYLVKELLNRYDPHRDAFVYVADGGHRENLGLVELLRERPDTVFCVDASGDAAGSFQTLREAIELALVELGIDIDIDLASVRNDSGLPADCAAEGVIHYPAAMGGGTGRLLYGRSQLSESAPPGLLQFGASDERFPSYSTLDQYLTDAEHVQLVALGHHVTDRLVGLFERATP